MVAFGGIMFLAPSAGLLVIFDLLTVDALSQTRIILWPGIIDFTSVLLISEGKYRSIVK
jgi:hypothetical protein